MEGLEKRSVLEEAAITYLQPTTQSLHVATTYKKTSTKRHARVLHLKHCIIKRLDYDYLLNIIKMHLITLG